MESTNQNKEYCLFQPKTERWIGKKGTVTVKKYARIFTDMVEIEAIIKHFQKNHIEVEIQEF